MLLPFHRNLLENGRHRTGRLSRCAAVRVQYEYSTSAEYNRESTHTKNNDSTSNYSFYSYYRRSDIYIIIVAVNSEMEHVIL